MFRRRCLVESEKHKLVDALASIDSNLLCWEEISEKSYVTWFSVVKYPHLPWSPQGLSRNPNITFQDVLDNPLFPWCFRNLCQNPNITLEIVSNYPDYPWDYEMLSYGRLWPDMLDPGGCTWTDYDVSKYLRLDLITDLDLEHITLSSSFILATPHLPWNYRKLSSSELITCDDVEAHLDLPWCFQELSSNPNLTITYVLSKDPSLWDWTSVSSNENITIDDIQRNHHLPWRYDYVTYRSDFTIDFYFNHQHLNWDLWTVSKSSVLKWEDVLKGNNWDYDGLSRNENITWKHVQTQLDKPWNWDVLSQRLDVDWFIVKQHPELPWNHKLLSKNEMNHRLEQLNADIEKYLAKKVYYRLIERMSLPPFGYYFLIDLETQLKDSGQDYQQFRRYRLNRDYNQLLTLIGCR